MRRMQLRSKSFVSALALVTLWIGQTPTQASPRFRAVYTGTYHVAFGAGANGWDHLTFSGPGHATHLGSSEIDGRSDMAPTATPNCTSIENDAVTLTAANGDKLFIVNTGVDCLSSDGTVTALHGSGQTTITGGTGRFQNAHGAGSWEVTAPVTSFQPTFADGTFELSFDADLSY